MKKKCWIVLCVVFMLSVAAGCGSKSMETMSDFASGESSMNAAIENEDYKNEGEIAAEEGITSENGLDGQVAAGRKLIRTVYLSLQTTEFDSVLSNLSEKTAELGGYIENSSVSGHSYYYNNTRYASYTIRICRGCDLTVCGCGEPQKSIGDRAGTPDGITFQCGKHGGSSGYRK